MAAETFNSEQLQAKKENILLVPVYCYLWHCNFGLLNEVEQVMVTTHF